MRSYSIFLINGLHNRLI